MSISMLHSTKEALGADASRCTSRSLFIDKFADPKAKDDAHSTPRKDWFNRLIKKPAERREAACWLPDGSQIIHARLQSRLMLNMAGGVMENAGLLLDRYGLPYIPGSASKACARRMALQALHDWHAASIERHSDGVSENATEPKRPAADDICAPCCKDFTTPAEMLAAIALVFGWVQDDWKPKKNHDKKGNETTWKSDFAWAVAGDEATLSTARQRLPKADAFAGSIAFLPAHPNVDPGLELDVVTPHHTAYYSGDLETATDTEDPVPVFFPAVKPQKETDHFTFPLIPLHLAHADSLTHAKTWLGHGLEIFGIGAKTNAGYGWFAPLDGNSPARAQLAREKTHQMALVAQSRHQAAMQRKAEELADKKQRKEQKDRDDKAAEIAAKTADEWSAEYSALTDAEKIANLIKAFDTMTDNQRLGFLRVLASSDHKKRRKQWLEHPEKQKFIHLWQAFGKMLTPPVNI